MNFWLEALTYYLGQWCSMSSYVYSPKGKYYAGAIWLWTRKNAKTGEKKSVSPPPPPRTTNCYLAASVRSPVADRSPSLLGKCLNAIWQESSRRNAGRSTNCLLLNGGKLLPSSGLLTSQPDAMQRMKRSWYRAWQWKCLRKKGFDDTSSAALWHYTPKQHLWKLSCKKPVRCGSSSRSHSALLWRLSYCSKGHYLKQQ